MSYPTQRKGSCGIYPPPLPVTGLFLGSGSQRCGCLCPTRRQILLRLGKAAAEEPWVLAEERPQREEVANDEGTGTNGPHYK